MNILLTITAFPPSIGGAQTYASRTASGLLFRHSVKVAAFWNSNRTDWLLGTSLFAPIGAEKYLYDGIPVHPIQLSFRDRVAMLPYVMSYYPMMDYALPAISAHILPHLLECAGSPDLINNIRVGREPLSHASMQLARRLDVPFILTPLHHPRWTGWLYRHYLQLYRQADALIVLTENEKRTLAGLGVSENRMHVTGVGPVLAETANPAGFRQKYQLGSDPVILFLGQKYPYKGIEALLKSTQDVWKRHPSAHFFFIGPQTGFSKHLFAGVNDKRLHEFGSVDLQTKTDALSACSLLCLPSLQESFGGVFTEAWSFKKPVIGCLIPAVTEVIDHGENGFLVDQKPGEIAARINELLSDSSLCHAMGCAGFLKVQQHYTWANITHLTEKVYSSALGVFPSDT